MVSKRYNTRVPYQINNHQYRQDNTYRNERPRLHDMPYNTNWKDGKHVIDRPRSKETPNPLKNRGEYMVNNNIWCEICDEPHSSDHYIVAQKIQE